MDEFEWIQIPAGTFRMGDASGGDASAPLHSVTLTHPFQLSTRSVTFQQFAHFVAATRHRTHAEKSGFAVGPAVKYYQRIQGTNWRNAWPGLPETVPVTCVSWFDAVVFCKWFGKSNRCKCRLPTEAEWEYACRAGSETAFNASARIHDLGWFGGNSGDDVFDGERLIYRGLEEYFDRVMKEHGRPHPVGLKQPNKWGLHDMHGNVWEWCSDAFGDYPRGPVTNPKGPFVFRTPEFRCARGGDWYDPPPIATSFNRGNWQPAVGYTHVGFRLVREC